jgi:3-phosphoshikimate 1-carboxyvinyltransferase
MLKQALRKCNQSISKATVDPKEMTVESDWSSASYFFCLVALSETASITLSSYKETSLQGDSALVKIYKQLKLF